jgi:hypothetical protein
MKKSHNCVQNGHSFHQFFHENQQFFKVFEITRTHSSFILIVSKTQNWWFSDSEYLKTGTSGYLQNQIPIQHWVPLQDLTPTDGIVITSHSRTSDRCNFSSI